MDNNYYGNICYCRRCNGVVHTIKKGDTLYLISKYYKVPIGEIMNANRNLNIYNLQIGDEICIPVRRPEPVEPGGNNAMLRENMTDGNAMTVRGGMMTDNTAMAGDGAMNDTAVTGMDDDDIMAGRDSIMNNDNMAAMTGMPEAGSVLPDMETASAMRCCADEGKGPINPDDRLSDVLERENMTVGEFVKLMRKYS